MSKIIYERPVITKLNTGISNKFGTRTEYTPVTDIDGVSVKSIIKEHGSPCFVISEKQLRKNIRSRKKWMRIHSPGYNKKKLQLGGVHV